MSKNIIGTTVLNEWQTKAITIAANLAVPDGAAGEKIGDKWYAWQAEFIAKIFDSLKEIQSGSTSVLTRSIREFFLLIPKKNGKSTLSGALAIVFMLLNKRNNNEFAIIAPTKIVALNSFIPIKSMINADPYLRSRFKVIETTKTILDRLTNSKLTIYSADTATVTGIKAAFVIFDELWKLCEGKNVENILLEAKGGFVSKPEAFCVYLSTQSETPPPPTFARFLELARRPQEEQADAGFYSLVFEPKNQDTLKIDEISQDLIDEVNPNLGVTVDKKYLVQEFDKYKQIGGDAFLSFCAKHLNIQIKTEFQQNGWAGAEYWKSAEVELTIQELCERSECAIIGIDGGGLDDLIGVCVAGRDKDNPNNWLLYNTALCTDSALHKNNTEELYAQFIDNGELLAFGSIEQCYNYLVDIINIIANYDILSYIGMDINGAEILRKHFLENCIITDEQIVGIFQGKRLSSAIRTLEQLLALGRLKVNRSVLMRWQVNNIKMNAMSFFEKKEKKAKIDTAVAMAIAAVLINTDPIPLSTSELGLNI